MMNTWSRIAAGVTVALAGLALTGCATTASANQSFTSARVRLTGLNNVSNLERALEHNAEHNLASSMGSVTVKATCVPTGLEGNSHRFECQSDIFYQEGGGQLAFANSATAAVIVAPDGKTYVATLQGTGQTGGSNVGGIGGYSTGTTGAGQTGG
jgi:hypothetical protein